MQLPKDTSYCYMFEAIGEHNPVICEYDTNRIVLLGVRSLATLKEEWPEGHAAKHGWPVANTFPLTSLAEVQQR